MQQQRLAGWHEVTPASNWLLMRRVLYVMPNAVPGGAERVTMLMLAHHDLQRYEPGVLFFNDGPLVGEARALRIRTHVLGRPLRLRDPFSVGAAIAESSRLIRDEQYALLHSCMSYGHLIGGSAAARAHVPAVLYQHGPLGGWMDGAATVLRCDHILTNSAFSADAQRAHSWRQRPVTVAPCAVDLTIPDDERANLVGEVNAEHGLSPDTAVVGIVARFDPLKGIDVAIRAVAPLLRHRQTMRFMVIGGQYNHFYPECEGELRALVASEGIGQQVIFAGYRANVRPYYARLDALVNASLQPEGFGLTIIEAMAAGVPVIAPRVGGPAEIVDDGVDGLLHTPGDEAALRNALMRILDDEPFRRSMIAAGHSKVERRYRPHAMMSVIEQVYDQLLQDAA